MGLNASQSLVLKSFWVTTRLKIKSNKLMNILFCSEMINSVAEINMVTFLDNFFTIGVVAAIFSRSMMYVTGTGKYTVFHFVINN